MSPDIRQKVRELRLGQGPAGIPTARWERMIQDARAFAGDPRWEDAAALGWTDLDLFGVDGTSPYARVDQLGMIWFLDGGKIIVLTEQLATFESSTGARSTYAHRPGRAGRVLPWELKQ